MKKYWFLVVSFMSILLLGCDDMNDKHDIYLKEGEILYIGRIDSARLLPGNERFLLRYWITDSRAKELKIFWEGKKDSLVTSIPSHHPLDSLDIIIGDEQRKIDEGSHVIEIFSTDGESLRSIKYESIINVYGPKYASTLFNRQIKSAKYNSANSSLVIDWSEATSAREVGIEIFYTNVESGSTALKLPSQQVGQQTILQNIDLNEEILYRTMYLPEPLAIDTFYTAKEYISNIVQ